MSLFLGGVITFLLLLLSLLVLRAIHFGRDREPPVEPVLLPAIDEEASRRLSEILRFPTVSFQDEEKIETVAFLDLHSHLERQFPRVHASLRRETVQGLSLLYTWRGIDSDLPPVLLMAHQDVVPAPPDAEKSWSHPPFSGSIADGFIWGRGALDVKSSLSALLEALEMLLGEGFQPRRTLLLSFGHDEEVGGGGNAAVAGLLKERYGRLEFVLDEGEAVLEGILPGVPGPVALVGIAEKGYVSLTMNARSRGGHSSMPPSHTAIGLLGRALARLEDHPFPPDLFFIQKLFSHLGPRLSFLRRLVLANLWLTRPWVLSRLARSPEINAFLRTTAAPTLMRGGLKENILPEKASAVVNLRIMPGETVARTVTRIRRLIADPAITVVPSPLRSEPSPVSDIRSPGYEILKRTIRQIDGRTAVAPSLVVGATDSRYFTPMCNQIFRFVPLRLNSEDLNRIHGRDERISVANYREMVQFYHRLVLNLQNF